MFTVTQAGDIFLFPVTHENNGTLRSKINLSLGWWNHDWNLGGPITFPFGRLCEGKGQEQVRQRGVLHAPPFVA